LKLGNILDRRSFGGGPDLTPLYIAEEDVNHFHSDGYALFETGVDQELCIYKIKQGEVKDNFIDQTIGGRSFIGDIGQSYSFG